MDLNLFLSPLFWSNVVTVITMLYISYSLEGSLELNLEDILGIMLALIVGFPGLLAEIARLFVTWLYNKIKNN